MLQRDVSVTIHRKSLYIFVMEMATANLKFLVGTSFSFSKFSGGQPFSNVKSVDFQGALHYQTSYKLQYIGKH